MTRTISAPAAAFDTTPFSPSLRQKAVNALLPWRENSSALDDALRWAQGQNWTRDWLDLVDGDPTVRLTHAEYVPQSKEVRTTAQVFLTRMTACCCLLLLGSLLYRGYIGSHGNETWLFLSGMFVSLRPVSGTLSYNKRVPSLCWAIFRRQRHNKKVNGNGGARAAYLYRSIPFVCPIPFESGVKQRKIAEDILYNGRFLTRTPL